MGDWPNALCDESLALTKLHQDWALPSVLASYTIFFLKLYCKPLHIQYKQDGPFLKNEYSTEYMQHVVKAFKTLTFYIEVKFLLKM